MKIENPGHSVDENAEDLAKWCNEQPGDKINPLLLLDGRAFISALKTDS